MSEAFIGEIRPFPYTFAPLYWAECDGQLLNINSYPQLYKVIGTLYGGDGRNTFALPDLRGLVPVGVGAGQGLTPYTIASTGGATTVGLTLEQQAPHTHGLGADNEIATDPTPSPAMQLARGQSKVGTVLEKVYCYAAAVPDAKMNPAAIAPVGGGKPHNNMMAYLALNFCIAVQGVFPLPPRSEA